MIGCGQDRPLSAWVLLTLIFCLLRPAAVQGQAPGDEQMRPARSAAQVNAQTPSGGPTAEPVEEIVVVGTRARPRTVIESVVPIDVISSDDLVGQGEADIADRLRTVLPSYNVNAQPVGDAARIVRPAGLRGLAPDHTLVLVNGRRRHRSAIITWLGGGVADGAQGPDISVIPSIALRQVEVLRDGASAQYGSDAIAGVLNFLIRDDTSGSSWELRTGRFLAGDGGTYTVSGNLGLPYGQEGFANLSVEYGNTDDTSRSVQRADAAALVSSGNAHVADPAQIWGSPQIDDNFKFWGNFGRVFDTVQLYGHTNYARRRVTGGFFFRNPNTRAGVFSVDAGKTLLIGDALDARDGILDGSAGCPQVPVANGVPRQEDLTRILSDPNCFSFQERFPGGFTPRFGGELADASVVGGLRGQSSAGMVWDAHFSLGSNAVDFFIFNTVNASLGPSTPIDFDPGLYRQQDIGIGLDLSYAVNERIHVAGGGEWREEDFKIGLGQRESWEIGPYAPQGFSAGSNGFPGFSPIAAGQWDRGNYALYGDVELRGDSGRWTAAAAVRFEDFDNFGATTNGKLAGRYQLTQAWALRGSASSGFRAPTPGQQNAFNVSTRYDVQLMELVNDGIIPSTSRVAELRGGRLLEPERSINYSLGTVVAGEALSFSADYFRIDLSDRLALTQSFALNPEEVESLIAEGVTSARNLQSFRFFTNDFDTTTQGIDLVATYRPASLGGGTTFSLLYNYTDTDVTQFNPDVVDDERIRQLQEATPGTRWNLTAHHGLGRWRVLGRLSYYDDWYDWRDARVYSGEHLFDLEASYPFGESAALSIGVQNLFDNRPEENPNAAAAGNRYSAYAPFNYNGAFYYFRIHYNRAWRSGNGSIVP
ncbi:MAG: TonB-dependent receptor [Gammaproteobacteria bacterium]|nr:TonB-dependent receptor [Gammaproteobacteria bacterium]